MRFGRRSSAALPPLGRALPPWAAQLKNKKNPVIFGMIWYDLAVFTVIYSYFSKAASLDSEDFYFFLS
jgi:hypothetical protein